MKNPITFIYDYVNACIRIHNTIKELSQLSDRELKDLRICRWDIPKIAIESIVKKFDM
jgi:uncharacterized protein YjiS (DUF1127 family)